MTLVSYRAHSFLASLTIQIQPTQARIAFSIKRSAGSGLRDYSSAMSTGAPCLIYSMLWTRSVLCSYVPIKLKHRLINRALYSCGQQASVELVRNIRFAISQQYKTQLNKLFVAL